MYIDPNKKNIFKEKIRVYRQIFVYRAFEEVHGTFTSEKYRSVSKSELDTSRQVIITRIYTYTIVLLENIDTTL